MNLIEQNNAGTVFGLAYQDNGVFHLSVIAHDGEELATLNVSELLGIDALSLPVTGFFEPLITCCFMNNEDIFVHVYHRLERMSYYFTYSYQTQTPSYV